VLPAYDHVDESWIMAVREEGLTLVFELDPQFLPPAFTDFSPCDAVGKARLNRLDLEVKSFMENAEEVNHAEFVDGGTGQRFEIHKVADDTTG